MGGMCFFRLFYLRRTRSFFFDFITSVFLFLEFIRVASGARRCVEEMARRREWRQGLAKKANEWREVFVVGLRRVVGVERAMQGES